MRTLPTLVQATRQITAHTAYLGAGHKLRGSQGALGCGTDDFVLLSGVGGCAGHCLRLQDQGGRRVGHSLGQRQESVLRETGITL